MCVGLAWTAPELLRKIGNNDSPIWKHWSKAADIYSFGIIMQEVLLKGAPFCSNKPLTLSGSLIAWLHTSRCTRYSHVDILYVCVLCRLCHLCVGESPRDPFPPMYPKQFGGIWRVLPAHGSCLEWEGGGQTTILRDPAATTANVSTDQVCLWSLYTYIPIYTYPCMCAEPALPLHLGTIPSAWSALHLHTQERRRTIYTKFNDLPTNILLWSIAPSRL